MWIRDAAVAELFLPGNKATIANEKPYSTLIDQTSAMFDRENLQGSRQSKQRRHPFYYNAKKSEPSHEICFIFQTHHFHTFPTSAFLLLCHFGHYVIQMQVDAHIEERKD